MQGRLQLCEGVCLDGGANLVAGAFEGVLIIERDDHWKIRGGGKGKLSDVYP